MPVQEHEIKNLETLDRVGTVVLGWYSRARKNSAQTDSTREVVHDGAKVSSSEVSSQIQISSSSSSPRAPRRPTAPWHPRSERWARRE